jgi:CRISPR-associated protein Csm1
MFDLGSCLFGVKAVVRSKRSDLKGAVDRLYLPGFYYYLFSETTSVLAIEKAETKFFINNWKLENYRADKTVSLLLGNYGQLTLIEGESGFMPASEMAEQAKNLGCIARIGYLRMDVDRLGQIFAKGLGNEQTLTRLAGLSRQMSYFFKVYLNSLAEDRLTNLLQIHENVKSLTQKPRQNLLFIYAGGDDLFVSGAWNEVVEFAFDIYQSFRAYTGKNPDITLSGGISITDAKFPLYQAADESGEAEDAAKSNGRDSLGLFSEVFKWDEWLGIEDIAVIDKEIKNYLNPEATPNLLGIFPFVKELLNQVEISYSRSFIRNLLLTADLQEKMIKKIKDKPLEQQRDIRYYLHLPKVAYTLARLPDNIRNARSFEPVRTSLKSPYNAPYFRAIATWLELLNRS